MGTNTGLEGQTPLEGGRGWERNDVYYEYSTLMSSMHVSVSKHLLNHHFTAIWANDFYYEIIRYPKEEYEFLFHNNVDEFYRDDPADLAQIQDAVSEALEYGRPGYECICRMPCKGGTHIWVRLVGTFTKEIVDGYPIVYTVFTDITDLIQVRTEQSVTYNNLPGFAAKFLVGETLQFVDANDRFIQFFGERGPGDPPYGLVNLDAECNREVIRRNLPAMRAGKPVHFVVQARGRDGEEVWLQISADCVDHQQGQPLYLVIYIDITDITEQRELQKKLEERSEMLRGALEMAERANRAKSDFLSRMSHDIRTPMNAIMGMITIAKERVDDPERVRDCLDKVETSAKFLLSLINDILDMSKIESGKMILKKKPFDFVGFLRNITAMFFPQAQEKQVSFHVSTAFGLSETYIGDELKLNQILINLLGNAMKFTDAGGSVELSIASGKRTGYSSELVFTVKDTGIGMDPEFLGKVFEPFEQDGNQKRGRDGSGLGLAIAANYARMMNGSIEADSKPGQGSAFTIHVWLDEAADHTAPVYLKDRFRGLRVLIADADKDAGEYSANLFQRFGTQAEHVLSDAQALGCLRAAKDSGSPFDILLADWKLPHSNGIELARQVRGLFPDGKPVIAICAFDWSSIREEALAAGADHFLQRPLFPSTVYDFLMAVTQGRPVAVDKGRLDAFSGERILLVEDNDLNMEIAQTLLESRGLNVDIARDGREALDRFSASETGSYFAILMDIQMPVMDGLEATRRIRALNRPDAASVAIIAMSANAFDDDVERSFEVGMNAHISKPVDIPALFQTLRELRGS